MKNTLRTDMEQFIEKVLSHPTDLKSLKIKAFSFEGGLDLLKKYYGLLDPRKESKKAARLIHVSTNPGQV